MMPQAEDKWSKHVHAEHGGLMGWCERCPPDARHEALRNVAKTDGYATMIRRLNYVRNVANRENNEGLRSVAGEDVEWAEKNLHS